MTYTLLLNGVSMSNTRIKYRHSYDKYLYEMSNSESIC